MKCSYSAISPISIELLFLWNVWNLFFIFGLDPLTHIRRVNPPKVGQRQYSDTGEQVDITCISQPKTSHCVVSMTPTPVISKYHGYRVLTEHR